LVSINLQHSTVCCSTAVI